MKINFEVIEGEWSTPMEEVIIKRKHIKVVVNIKFTGELVMLLNVYSFDSKNLEFDAPACEEYSGPQFGFFWNRLNALNMYATDNHTSVSDAEVYLQLHYATDDLLEDQFQISDRMEKGTV